MFYVVLLTNLVGITHEVKTTNIQKSHKISRIHHVVSEV